MKIMITVLITALYFTPMTSEAGSPINGEYIGYTVDNCEEFLLIVNVTGKNNTLSLYDNKGELVHEHQLVPDIYGTFSVAHYNGSNGSILNGQFVGNTIKGQIEDGSCAKGFITKFEAQSSK